MPLRLLDYMTRIWLRHSEQHGIPLPPVIPFVLHQGPGAWTVSTAFADMIAFPPGLEAHLTPHVPHFSHALLDLTQCEPATEEHDDALRVVLHLMKCARERQGMLLFFEWLAAQTFVIPDSLTRLSLLYALMADASLDPKKIAATLQPNSELHKTVMSTAEYLIAQGRKEGLLKGRQEGRQEGEMHGLWVGKLQVLQELMGLPVSDRADLSDLTATDLEQRFCQLQKDYAVRFKSR